MQLLEGGRGFVGYGKIASTEKKHKKAAQKDHQIPGGKKQPIPSIQINRSTSPFSINFFAKQKDTTCIKVVSLFGGDGGTRTHDLTDVNRAL